jgi:hypothetical protein
VERTKDTEKKPLEAWIGQSLSILRFYHAVFFCAMGSRGLIDQQ